MCESNCARHLVDEDLLLKVDDLLLKCRIRSDINNAMQRGEMSKHGPFFIDTNVVPVKRYQEGLLTNGIDPVRILTEIAGLSGWGEPLYQAINYAVSEGFLCSVSVRGKEVVSSWRGWRPNLAQIMAAATFLNFLGFVVNVDFYMAVFPGWSHIGDLGKYLKDIFEEKDDLPHVKLISGGVLMKATRATSENEVRLNRSPEISSIRRMERLFHRLTKQSGSFHTSAIDVDEELSSGLNPREFQMTMDYKVTDDLETIKVNDVLHRIDVIVGRRKRKSENPELGFHKEVKSGRLNLNLCNKARDKRVTQYRFISEINKDLREAQNLPKTEENSTTYDDTSEGYSEVIDQMRSRRTDCLITLRSKNHTITRLRENKVDEPHKRVLESTRDSTESEQCKSVTEVQPLMRIEKQKKEVEDELRSTEYISKSSSSVYHSITYCLKILDNDCKGKHMKPSKDQEEEGDGDVSSTNCKIVKGIEMRADINKRIQCYVKAYENKATDYLDNIYLEHFSKK